VRAEWIFIGTCPNVSTAPAQRRDRSACFLSWLDKSAIVTSRITRALGLRHCEYGIALGTLVAVSHLSVSEQERSSNGRPGGRLHLPNLWDHCMRSRER
jgi:hypothetical protein